MFTIFVLACNVLAYFAVVRGGSRTIELQRGQLTQRIDEISQAMSREKVLRDKVEHGARKVFDENERFLRTVGADLHDGPAQLIGLALLKLDGQDGDQDETNIAQARSAITQAMREVRAIAAGLLLPDISGQTLEDCRDATVRSHEAKTGTKVRLTFSALPADCPDQVKVCVCRFIQEGLANSFRHARGIGQRVLVAGEADFVRVTVADSGPGMPKAYAVADGAHLGLSSLRGRLESVKGTMTVSSWPRRGTRLVARLPLRVEEPDGV
jgi:signal transduction histidine kinase